MKKVRGMLLLLSLTLIILLVSCGSKAKYSPRAVYYLEGGDCKNTQEKISYVYNFSDGESVYLYDPQQYIGSDGKSIISKSGFHIEGWYQTKNEDGTYSDIWNFETDKMTYEGVTLYANWVPNITYSYQLVYFDENNVEQTLWTYSAVKGSVFNDLFSYANTRTGYSFIEFTDESGNLWDSTFTHPGGDTDLAIKVYATYIKGTYAIVRTKDELLAATSKNIYLMNDIDMEGASLSFGNYINHTLNGNGHKIYNFKVGYTANRANLLTSFDGTGNSLYVSLFQIIQNSIIQDVEFSDFEISGQISLSMLQAVYVSPFTVECKKSTISNVTVNGTYNYTIGSTNTSDFNLYEVIDEIYHNIDTDSIITNTTVVINKL